MKHLQKQCIYGVCMIAIGIGAMAWQSHANKRVAPSTPAVLVTVDIERVFEALEERASEQSNLQSMIDKMKEALETRRLHIEDIKSEFELYKEGSAKWNELMQEFQLASLEYQAQVEYTRSRTVREESRGMRRVYEHIREASAELSKLYGWDYVLVNDAIVELPIGDNTDMAAQISSRRMLFANSIHDVTNTLIEHMNASFDEMAVRP